MKFYEFNDYEYYALIAVGEDGYPMHEAINAYKEEIDCDIEDESDDTPDEITRHEAYKKFKKACINNYSNLSELIQAFQKSINLDDRKYSILLIDGSLL